jgi:cytochrome c oxidase subunit 3
MSGVSWTLDQVQDHLVLRSIFYLLTGFYGLNVLVCVISWLVMVICSFIPRNYDKGHFGVSPTTLFWYSVDIV